MWKSLWIVWYSYNQSLLSQFLHSKQIIFKAEGEGGGVLILHWLIGGALIFSRVVAFWEGTLVPGFTVFIITGWSLREILSLGFKIICATYETNLQYAVSNSNWTECSSIQGVIRKVIPRSHLTALNWRADGVGVNYKKCNWTAVIIIIIAH